MKSKAAYTQGSIRQIMCKTALAMVAGTLALSGYNLADTYFVGRLPGSSPLAAMGFTFPAIMLVGCLFRGLIVGVMTTAAQAIGAKKQKRAARLVTCGLLMIFLFSIIMAILGISTGHIVFQLFGARGDTLELVKGYMNIWYFGCATGFLAMAGNDLLIAVGDSKMASCMMILGMVINVILDPLFIFGWQFIPAMGIRGAAVATIISQCISTVIVLTLLQRRHKLLTWQKIPFDVLFPAWQHMIRYAIPACIGMLMIPLGSSILTRITAEFGDVAVAATAAAGRLEMVAFVVPMSLGMSLMPFVAQNYGAKLYDRIREGRRFAMRFAFVFLTGAAVIYTLFADHIVVHFSTVPEVQKLMAEYLRIVSWGLAGVEMHRFSGFFYTGCGRPSMGAFLNGMRMIGFLVPLSLLALYFHSLTGLFVARLVTDVVSCIIAYTLARRMTQRLPADGEVHLTVKTASKSAA